MKKQVLIIGITLVLITVGLCGCESEPPEKEHNVAYLVKGYGPNVTIKYSDISGNLVILENESLPWELILSPFHRFESPMVTAIATQVGNTNLKVEIWVDGILKANDSIQNSLEYAKAYYVIPVDSDK